MRTNVEHDLLIGASSSLSTASYDDWCKLLQDPLFFTVASATARVQRFKHCFAATVCIGNHILHKNIHTLGIATASNS